MAKKLNIFVILYLDYVFIYTNDSSQAHFNVFWLIFEKLSKYSFFANLKKCHFYNNEIYFLGYIISDKRVKIENKQIKVVEN